MKTRIQSGRWQGQNGSCLNLTVHDNGQVAGTYNTAYGRPDINESFDVTGFVNSDLIGFVVSWGKHQSITSWTGRYFIDDDGRETIKTVWHLARLEKSQGIPAEVWETFLTNGGVLYRETGYIP